MTDQEKKQPAKEALFAAAEQLFTEKGYAAVSTRELAELADVNLGAITYHFGSKANLFVETVKRLMLQRRDAFAVLELPSEGLSAEAAAAGLCVFIRQVLKNFCAPDGPDVCRLMQREVLGATSQDPEMYEPLVNAVVNDFIRPLDARIHVLIKVLHPEASEQKINFIIQSIIGQCAYYSTNRPFVEKLRGMDFTSEAVMEEVAAHIISFTLRAIGQSDEQITTALNAAGSSIS